MEIILYNNRLKDIEYCSRSKNYYPLPWFMTQEYLVTAFESLRAVQYWSHSSETGIEKCHVRFISFPSGRGQNAEPY